MAGRQDGILFSSSSQYDRTPLLAITLYFMINFIFFCPWRCRVLRRHRMNYSASEDAIVTSRDLDSTVVNPRKDIRDGTCGPSGRWPSIQGHSSEATVHYLIGVGHRTSPVPAAMSASLHQDARPGRMHPVQPGRTRCNKMNNRSAVGYPVLENPRLSYVCAEWW